MEPLKRILDLSNSKFNKDTEFEKALNLKPKTVDSWKRGNSKGYYQILPSICSLLEVSADYLLGLDDVPNRNIQLSEDKWRLLKMYDLLTDMEKGEILGELKMLTRDIPMAAAARSTDNSIPTKPNIDNLDDIPTMDEE